MDLVTERSNDTLVVEAWNRVDGSNAREFEKSLMDSINDEDRVVVLDFEHLAYISSAGLRVVLLTAKTLSKRRGKFVICALAAPIREIFEISGFDKIIPIHKSRAEALSAVGS